MKPQDTLSILRLQSQHIEEVKTSLDKLVEEAKNSSEQFKNRVIKS